MQNNTDQNKIVGTGLSGLVGSRVVELLSSKYSFEDISRKTGTDITDANAVLERLQRSDASSVIHMAGYTNVDGAQEQKEKDIKILGYQDIKKQQEEFALYQSPWAINVTGTENVVKACEATEKKLIYISTDFVFDGENVPDGGYTEDSTPNPVNWYAQTKYEGEKVVQASSIPWLIVRIAYPYRANFEKNDFMRAMKNRLSSGQEIKAITDHTYSPTFIDDIAPALDMLISEDKTGMYHVTGSESLSPHDAAMKIAEMFNLDKNLIGTTTRSEYFAGKAERPLDLSMNNAKIKSLGVVMHGFTEGLNIIKNQLGE